MLNTIGPIWDGNEVWLIVAGGATFAAFPLWYATMFSGFYPALLAILVCLILRVVSFEWRGKGDTPRWSASGERGHQLHGRGDLGRRSLEPPRGSANRFLAGVHRQLP